SIYIARLNLTAASPALEKAGTISPEQLGILGAAFSIVFAIGRFINGSISDKKHPYIMISIGLVLCGLANIIIGYLPFFISMLLLWSVNAFAQSMLWSSVLIVLSAIYPPEKARKMSPIMVTSVAFGNVIAILFNAYLINTYSVMFAFIVPGAITLILAVCCFLVLRKLPIEQADAAVHQSTLTLFKNSDFRLILAPAILHGIIKENVTIWMALFIADRYKFAGLGDSIYFLLFVPLIGFFGRISYTLVFNLCKQNEHKASILGFAVCIISSVLLCANLNSMYVDIFLMGLIYAAISVANTSFLSIYPLRYARTGNIASVCGIMDLFTYMGAGLGSLLFGYM
ncbi:MAG: MFS transporter, partial [Oscillospiraceae bacterium]|nr:MFS transporter [Candidatus Equicaccousia limihippi]